MINTHIDWLPPYFEYRDGQLYIEAVRLDELTQTFGTPCYVYSANAISDAFWRYTHAFEQAGLDLSLCYAVKANSNIAILRRLGQLGAGADVVSGGELWRALEAGIAPHKIVFAGVGKTAAEIDVALSHQIRAFNIESAGELTLIEQRAQLWPDLPPVAISIRCNPDIVAATHPYISTGHHSNKFGVTFQEAHELARQIQLSPHLRLCGLQMHIGSQILDIAPVVEAFRRLVELAGQVETQTGQTLDYLDIGGGLGVRYYDEETPQPTQLAQALASILKEYNRKYPLVSEPGRYIVAEAGALLTQVLYLKGNEGINFAIVDAAMNDLLRPALYQAYHKIVPLNSSSTANPQNYEVVGPVCESGDWLGHHVKLAELASGAQLAILSAGAYGFTMSSNYNSRPRAVEVLVDGSHAQLIRRRETFEDLVGPERGL